jgi:hypothetical protein
MMLLTFTAALTTQLRFVSTVTILQQAIRLSFFGGETAWTAGKHPMQERPGESRVAACQSVEQALALFRHLRRRVN